MARAISAWGFSQPNTFSFTAGIAAYRSGAAWLDDLLRYLSANREYLAAFLREDFPELSMSETQGSYLAWIDSQPMIAALGLRDDFELATLLESEGRLRVSAGSTFRTGGEGHLRLNFACPRAQLEEGLSRLEVWGRTRHARPAESSLG
jgi:cystathionine beta-lyase